LPAGFERQDAVRHCNRGRLPDRIELDVKVCHACS
jgi:hypothetical protein